MKKYFILLIAMVLIVVAVFIHSNSQASTDRDGIVITTNLDSSYHVNLAMSLHNGAIGNQKFKFTYMPKENAYKITDLSESFMIGWDGTKKSDNITIKPNTSPSDTDLWILSQKSDGTYTINNKKDPQWVWNVTDSPAYNGDRLNIALGSSLQNSKLFYLK